VDDEPVQVLTAPPERGLQHDVQVGDRGVASDEQPPPDQRADPVQHHPQLVDVAVGADISRASIVSHRLILAVPVLAGLAGAGTGRGSGG